MPHYSERDNTSAVAGSEISLDRISPLIERISEKYLAAQLVEKKRNDELQLNAINATLKKWADQISTEMKKSQSSQSSGVEKAAAILDSAVGDSRDRQLKIVDVSILFEIDFVGSRWRCSGNQRSPQKAVGHLAPSNGRRTSTCPAGSAGL